MAWSWYTKGRRIPTIIGKDVSGRRIPGGPYTGLQAVTAAAVPALLWWTRGLWAADMAGLAMFAVLVGVTVAAVKLVGKVDFASTEPAAAARRLPPSDQSTRGRHPRRPETDRAQAAPGCRPGGGGSPRAQSGSGRGPAYRRLTADRLTAGRACRGRHRRARRAVRHVRAGRRRRTWRNRSRQPRHLHSRGHPRQRDDGPAAGDGRRCPGSARHASPHPDPRRTGLEAFLAGAAAARTTSTEEDAA